MYAKMITMKTNGNKHWNSIDFVPNIVLIILI